MNYKQKCQVISKGKKLDPLKVRHKAERLKITPKDLAEHFECTVANISKAYKGGNPFRLYQIKKYLINYEN